jgi:hypothetical protein
MSEEIAEAGAATGDFPPGGHWHAQEHARRHKKGQLCCPFELAHCSGKNYILHCNTAIGVAALLPFLGVSSLNFGPLRAAFFLSALF